MNVFIGPNNSGKSNILRYIRDFLVPITNIQRGKPSAISGINRSLLVEGDPQTFKILMPFDDEYLHSKFKFSHSRQSERMIEFFRGLPNVVGDDHLAITLPVDASNYRRVDVSSFDFGLIEHNLLQNIANSAGLARGNVQEWFASVLQHLLEPFLEAHETKYVPAFRQVKTKLSEFQHEYEKFNDQQHIVDQLVQFSNPTYENQEQKDTFKKLKRFISDISQIDDLDIEIPHDRSTINILANGYIRPIEALGSGIHELFMLAAEIVLNEGKIVLLEEPETHMHPEFQRKLMNFLNDEVDSQFFVTTHSPVIIDTDNAKVFGVSPSPEGGNVRALLSNQSKRNACRELGYRASDLLQANCIVWVEGPSDRTYLNAWLSEVAPSFREGIEYSVMFYGGRLLSHLSAEDTEVTEFINLLSINRGVAILIDSDLGSNTQTLRSTKVRVCAEVEEVGGFSWVTAGREIENYVPHDTREKVIAAVHKNFKSLSGSRNKFGKPLDFNRTDGDVQTKNFDKIKIAKLAVQEPINLDVFDLREKIEGLANFIRQQN